MAYEEEASISIPSLAFVAVLGYIIYRYFFASRNSGDSTSSSSRNGVRFSATQVEQISSMFPQLSRRDIAWDLHRNRGSVQATTERVLGGRGLDPAPPSFQPPISLTSTTPSTSGAPPPVKKEIDLITRYNLQTKVNSKGKEREEDTPASGWAATKEQRQQALQRRRDEMILAARRKLQEKEELGPTLS